MLFDASNHTWFDDVYSRFSDGTDRHKDDLPRLFGSNSYVEPPCDVRKRSPSQLTIGRRLHRRREITTFENVAAPNVEQHSQCEQHQTVRQGSRTNRISFLVVLENPKR